MKSEWVLCPVCGSKTRLKLREDTSLENYPLFCPKCKQTGKAYLRKRLKSGCCGRKTPVQLGKLNGSCSYRIKNLWRK